MTDNYPFDQDGRYVIQDYARGRPFASFLPGIAGPLGIPMWVFYVNRGQAIASFGVKNKDNPIMEFEPANKAYQTTPYTGFRTFIKLKIRSDPVIYEPFSAWSAGQVSRMSIGMNELELQTSSAAHGLRTRILYFTLPGEPFAGLVRQLTVTNTAADRLDLEILDGMPRVMPYGVNNHVLKEIGRTIEAWMAVFNLEQGVPFYRFQASASDTAEVSEIQAGHFYLTFDDSGQLLQPFIDPVVVFGQNTTLSTPDRFINNSMPELSRRCQISSGRTPCGLFGAQASLAPGESLSVHAIIGHTGNIERIQDERERLAQPAYLRRKRQEANQLTSQISAAIATQTASPLFDAYSRQTFLDNVLRGGWPALLGDVEQPMVYHIYSRKHGDLERDYNHFTLAAEPYSQGNANYRDVNQNRRCDVFFQPKIGDFNILSFLGLIQADGYNPLIVEGSTFTLPTRYRAAVLALVDQPEKLEPLLAQTFTPGQVLRLISDQGLCLKTSSAAFIAAALAHAEQGFKASFGEGFWIDHWTYNLDLIESYLAVYPEKKSELLFEKAVLPYFESPATVQPRTRKHVLVGKRARQYGAVAEDQEKALRITARSELPNLARKGYGQGPVFYTTVFAKLLGLALIKFATLDPLGMGIEMEAGKPGWYDAINGLPGLFGSSLCETYELERLLDFLLHSWAENKARAVELPFEQHNLLLGAQVALDAWKADSETQRDFRLWDALASAREVYRESIQLGFDGRGIRLSYDELAPLLNAFLDKVRYGIRRAVEMNDGLPPTYFAYTVEDYEILHDAAGNPKRDEQGRPIVRVKSFQPITLPLFLEGPVHALKNSKNITSARELYDKIRNSDLYDRKLGMYKVNAPLGEQTHEIGRARAFTPGWLENESIWLHMEYKFLLELLRAGLYEAFFRDFQRAGIPFQDPEVYGRSPLENSSFLVSSAHPDESLHGAGFVARLSGATAEFLSMWNIMMAGRQPFCLVDGKLCLAFRPALPGWLFDEHGRIRFTFLGNTPVVYHNPHKLDTWKMSDINDCSIILTLSNQEVIEFNKRIIPSPYAEMIRAGKVDRIEMYFNYE